MKLPKIDDLLLISNRSHAIGETARTPSCPQPSNGTYADTLTNGYKCEPVVFDPCSGSEAAKHVNLQRPARKYYPDSTLFLRFRDIDGSETAILNFAREYGLLGPPISRWVDVYPRNIDPHTGGLPRDLYYSDEIHKWVSEITVMRRVCHSRNELRRNNVINAYAFLDRYIQNRVDELDEYIHGFSSQSNSSNLHYRYATVARSIVFETIVQLLNDRIKYCSPALHVSGLSDTLNMSLQATSLYTVIWLQLAYAIDHNKEFSKCERCGNWFEAGQSKTKKIRKYCSTACRVAAHRARKEHEL